MINHDEVVAKLNEWRARDYFTKWEERGLMPSGEDVQKALEKAKNSLVDDMLNAIRSGAGQEQMVLLGLNHFTACLDNRNLDTEESEFLADCITQLADSIGLEGFYDRSEKLMMERHNL